MTRSANSSCRHKNVSPLLLYSLALSLLVSLALRVHKASASARNQIVATSTATGRMARSMVGVPMCDTRALPTKAPGLMMRCTGQE